MLYTSAGSADVLVWLENSLGSILWVHNLQIGDVATGTLTSGVAAAAAVTTGHVQTLFTNIALQDSVSSTIAWGPCSQVYPGVAQRDTAGCPVLVAGVRTCTRARLATLHLSSYTQRPCLACFIAACKIVKLTCHSLRCVAQRR